MIIRKQDDSGGSTASMLLTMWPEHRRVVLYCRIDPFQCLEVQ